MSREDIGEIINVVNLYALAVDTLQFDLFDQVFTPDATVNFPKFTLTGIAPIKARFAESHAPLETTQHFISNHMVVVKRDEANAISYSRVRFVRNMLDGGGNWWETGGWYDDHLVRTPAGWLIDKRVCRTNWWDGNPRVAETMPTGPPRQGPAMLRKVAAAGEIAYVDAVRAKGRKP
jgi:hypothetical protein